MVVLISRLFIVSWGTRSAEPTNPGLTRTPSSHETRAHTNPRFTPNILVYYFVWGALSRQTLACVRLMRMGVYGYRGVYVGVVIVSTVCVFEWPCVCVCTCECCRVWVGGCGCNY